MTDTRVALVTAPDEGTARMLARTLVEEGVAACANLIPGIRSIYRWEGTVHDEGEVLLLFKLSRERVETFVRRVPELHPYEVPEVLILAVEGGFPPYLDWVARETGSPA